jgi:hypothetical protein
MSCLEEFGIFSDSELEKGFKTNAETVCTLAD